MSFNIFFVILSLEAYGPMQGDCAGVMVGRIGNPERKASEKQGNVVSLISSKGLKVGESLLATSPVTLWIYALSF
jgi:hypothetical protein